MDESAKTVKTKAAKSRTPPKPPLDEIQRREVCALLAVGCSRKTAADYVGCKPDVIRAMARRHADFAEQLRLSEAKCEVSALTWLNKAVKEGKNWRAVAWLLERRYPERYGIRKPRSASPRQIADVVQQFTEIVLAEVSDAGERRRIAERVQQVTERLRQDKEASES